MGNLYTSTTFMEHNSHPDYKYEMDAPTHEHDGINPSCGDELTLQLRVENNVIEEASFTGHGCAISQASADIMADLITGETVEEARRLAELFLAMIRGEQLSEEDLEDLDEAAQLQDISHMPAASNAPSSPGAPSTACSRAKYQYVFAQILRICGRIASKRVRPVFIPSPQPEPLPAHKRARYERRYSC